MAGILTSHSGLRPDAKRYVMAGRGVVVDKGGRGDFTDIQAAVDYMGARSLAGRIWVRAGTYASFDVTVAKLFIEGESWDTVIDGTTTDSAIWISGVRTHIYNLTAQTTGGGGADISAIFIDGGNMTSIDTVYIPDSDTQGMYVYSPFILVKNCEITGCDAHGINFGGPGDGSRVIGNYIYNNGGWGTTEHEAAEGILYVANHVTGNSSGQIQEASGTGVYVGNYTG